MNRNLFPLKTYRLCLWAKNNSLKIKKKLKNLQEKLFFVLLSPKLSKTSGIDENIIITILTF
jgi:hypothetical protein